MIDNATRLLITQDQINQIMRPIRLPNSSYKWGEGQYMEAHRRLIDVLSGKDVPFDGAVEYLQKIRSGKA